MTFNGSSSALKHTRIVPTLDTPMEDGMNIIWCSSFAAAWKTFSETIVEGDIKIEDPPETATLLNIAPDPRPDVPEKCLYTAAGFLEDGIVEKIRKDLNEKFPYKRAPKFPSHDRSSAIVYAYLEADVKYMIQYNQKPGPLFFTGSDGNKVGVMAFGIPSDNHTFKEQPRILFRSDNSTPANFEFALDLCVNSSPSQIIVACMKKEPSLAAALKKMEQREIKWTKKIRAKLGGYADWVLRGGIESSDTIFVPNMFWGISHRYTELVGRILENDGFQNMGIAEARQDILFRLDHIGAALKPESQFTPNASSINHDSFDNYDSFDYIVDRPFLICIKKRGASLPYFAMWVDNAELLIPW